jgi:colanic acid/amylovoran biosynthesis glycosyltransferase
VVGDRRAASHRGRDCGKIHSESTVGPQVEERRLIIGDGLQQRDVMPCRGRIVVITRSFPRLSETFVVDHVRALIQAGHEVVVVARRVDATLMANQFGAGLRAVQLPSWTAFGARALFVGARRATAWMRRHPTLQPNLIAWKRAFYAQRLKNLLVQLQPDLVHAHFGTNGIDAGIALEGEATPLVCNFHGFDATSFPLKHGWGLYHATLRQATLVAHSDFMEGLLVDHGLSRPTRIVLGVDKSIFKSRPRPIHWTAPLRLITIGRLDKKKGHDLAIDVLARLRQLAPELDARLRIVGAGPEAAELRKLARSLGVDEFISGPEPASHGEVATALGESDIALVPSRVMPDGWQESFCRVAIEAMTCGLPVVATPTGGLPDTVGSGGTIARRADAEALTEALLSTIRRNGPAEWARRVTTAADAYDISRMNSGYLELTKRLLRSVPER